MRRSRTFRRELSRRRAPTWREARERSRHGDEATGRVTSRVESLTGEQRTAEDERRSANLLFVREEHERTGTDQLGEFGPRPNGFEERFPFCQVTQRPSAMPLAAATRGLAHPAVEGKHYGVTHGLSN